MALLIPGLLLFPTVQYLWYNYVNAYVMIISIVAHYRHHQFNDIFTSESLYINIHQGQETT